jgi:hypothetical protein
MKNLIGYRAKVNLPKMLAGEMVAQGDQEWPKNYPEILEPIYEEQQKTIEQRVQALEDKFGVFKMYIKNL